MNINFDRFRSDFRAATKELAEKYDIHIELGTITHEPHIHEFRAKMTCQSGIAPIPTTSIDFDINQLVYIDHKKVSPTKEWVVVKINNKSIRLRSVDNPNETVKCAPSLMRKVGG